MTGRPVYRLQIDSIAEKAGLIRWANNIRRKDILNVKYTIGEFDVFSLFGTDQAKKSTLTFSRQVLSLSLLR